MVANLVGFRRARGRWRDGEGEQRQRAPDHQTNIGKLLAEGPGRPLRRSGRTIIPRSNTIRVNEPLTTARPRSAEL